MRGLAIGFEAVLVGLAADGRVLAVASRVAIVVVGLAIVVVRETENGKEK